MFYALPSAVLRAKNKAFGALCRRQFSKAPYLTTMGSMKIGLIREGKFPPDSWVLTPERCRGHAHNGQTSINMVQPSHGAVTLMLNTARQALHCRKIWVIVMY